MAIKQEEEEEEESVITPELESELTDKVKTLLLEVINKGRLDLTNSAELLSVAARKPKERPNGKCPCGNSC